MAKQKSCCPCAGKEATPAAAVQLCVVLVLAPWLLRELFLGKLTVISCNLLDHVQNYHLLGEKMDIDDGIWRMDESPSLSSPTSSRNTKQRGYIYHSLLSTCNYHSFPCF